MFSLGAPVCVWCSEFFKVKENMHLVKTRTQIVLAILTPQKIHAITLLSTFDRLFWNKGDVPVLL